ncbi:MAG: Phospho-N-acetylmuramoyl-pentapeptide-transferase, partial [uncultured Blastococcus sp.]
ARHADHGRRRDHRGDPDRLHRGAPVRHRAARPRADRERAARAVPHDRARRRRLPRRHHQDPQAALAGAHRGGQVRRAAHHRRGLRRARAAVPQRRRADAGLGQPVLRARLREHRVRQRRVRDLRVPDHHRDEQRGEPHRRAGRPGRRLLDHGLRGLRRDRLLAVPPVLRAAARAGPVLRGARPARPRPGRRRRHGRVLRLPVVERLAGQDLHGRHRLAGHRRHLRRHRDPHPHRAAAHRARRAVRHRDHLGDPADRRLQGHPQAGVQHGADPPPLRARRLGREHRHRPLLDHRRARRRLRPGRLLRRVPVHRPAAV